MATADKPRRASARAINKAGASISSSSASPATTAAPKASAASTAKKPPTSGSKRVAKKPTKRGAKDDEGEDDADELLAKVNEDTRKINPKRKRGAAASALILDEFMSLDALLDNDLEVKRRKQARERKLQKLREECDVSLAGGNDANGGNGGGGGLLDGASPLVKLMNDMESNMTSLSADNYLFSDDLATTNQEKFGYVFAPITEPLPYKRYEPTPSELSSDLKLVYRTMASADENEIGALLWSKAILLRCMPAKSKADDGVEPEAPVTILVPEKICSWLFNTSDVDAQQQPRRARLSKQFVHGAQPHAHDHSRIPSGLAERGVLPAERGLPHTPGREDVETPDGVAADSLRFPERVSHVRVPGQQAVDEHEEQDRRDAQEQKATGGRDALPRAQYAIRAHVFGDLSPRQSLKTNLCLFCDVCGARVLKLDGYDAFSFTMFFLRMQFETGMHPEIVQLASICIEELLEVFPPLEWRKEWAQSLVLRIAGVNEGLFDSAAGWLTVARRLPRTLRGTQLTTGLAIYVLQHRIDKAPQEGSNSERPLKFPIQSGLVLDIVAGIVEDLTLKYSEKRQSGKAAKTAPPYDLLCKKVALMDLALQAFLNILTQKEMALLLKKLDALTGTHKSTMSAKWHELKTLVSLMHRKYSLENLRIGRDASPSVKTLLFPNEDAK